MVQGFGPQAPLEMKSSSDFKIRIDDVLADANNSIALRVSQVTDAADQPLSPMVLKLFDRTFSPRPTSMERATRASETAYLEFVRSRKITTFLSTGIESLDQEDWTSAQNEAWRYRSMSQFHSAEMATYDALADLQGCHIPKFFADIRLDPGLSAESKQFPDYFLVKGVLIEYVEGFHVHELPTGAPESAWGTICDQVIKVVNLISDHGILNEDTTVENVLVRHVNDDYQVVFFDFAYCYPRSAYFSDEDWIEAKRRQDEEARLGARMELMVSRAKGKKGKKYKGKDPLPFIYRPSHRYGVPGHPLVLDEGGNLVDGVIQNIPRLPLGATKS